LFIGEGRKGYERRGSGEILFLGRQIFHIIDQLVGTGGGGISRSIVMKTLSGLFHIKIRSQRIRVKRGL
jgi:hypothetical protein